MSCILCHVSDEVVDELDFNDYESEACSKCRARLFHITYYWRFQNVGDRDWLYDLDAVSPEDEMVAMLDRKLHGEEDGEDDDTLAGIDMLNVLPDKKRRIVYMHLWEGMPFKDIGAVFGCSKQAVHQQYKKALAILKETYKDMCPG